MDQLEKEFGWLLSRQVKQVSTHQATKSSAHTVSMVTTTGADSTSALDFESVIKATQSISSQMVLGDLLEALMKIVLENAGAEKVFLVLKKGDELVIEARASLSGSMKTQIESIPVDQCPDLSLSIVRYVHRTKENLVIGDAANEGAFVYDPYVTANRPKSIFCMPILRQGNLVGILYLENNQATDAFTQKQIQVLNVLSSQAAISIENAKLYTELQTALGKAQESNRVKSEFLARTSHELRTPLNSIINIPKGLLEDFAPVPSAHCKACDGLFELEENDQISAETPCPRCQKAGTVSIGTFHLYNGNQEQMFQTLNTVQKAGTHLLGVVNDILDISKLEAGRMIIHPERVEIKSVIGDVVESLAPQANQQHIDILVSAGSRDLVLTADPLKLSQILYNLIGNAVKFSPRGGTILVNTALDGTNGVLSVQDQGIGISREHQSHLFESFHQVEGGSTRRFGGTGLGLAITKKLVELHGGKIWVESDVGKGSTFFVQLPLEMSSSEGGQPPQKEGAPR